MSEDSYFSAAYMVIDSYFIDEGVSTTIESEVYDSEIYPDDSMILALGDYVLQHTSAHDFQTKDVI